MTCTLDGSPLSCTSSTASPTISGQGSHTFTVTATDAATNATTRTYTWSVDTVKPVATIGTKPATMSNVTTPTFSVHLERADGGDVRVLDRQHLRVAPCSTPFTTPTLTQASHTFYVRAIDLAANHSTSPDSFTWTVDTTPPSVPASFQLVGAASTPDPPQFRFSAATMRPARSRTSSCGARRTREPSTTSCGGFLCMTDSTILADGTMTVATPIR